MARNEDSGDQVGREEPELIEKLVGINRVAKLLRWSPFRFCCSRSRG